MEDLAQFVKICDPKYARKRPRNPQSWKREQERRKRWLKYYLKLHKKFVEKFYATCRECNFKVLRVPRKGFCIFLNYIAC